MHIYILTITARTYFANPPLKYTHRYSNNYTHTKAPPAPLKAVANGKLVGALCQSDGRQNGRRECAFDNELQGCQHQ